MTTHTDGYRSPGEVSMAELFPNHDGLRPLAISDLVGRSIDAHLEEGTRVHLHFQQSEVQVEVEHYGSWLMLSGKLPCDVIPVRDHFLAAAISDQRTHSSYLLILDFKRSRLLLVHSDILSGPAGTGERTRFIQGGIGRKEYEPFERTSELVGKRLFWRYSDTHHFEHIYIEPNRYCWHGIKGPEAGMGGVEPASTFKLDDQLYLFSWSDSSVAFNGTIAINLRDNVRCSGRLFGWERSEKRGWQIVVGGPGQVLNITSYPD